MVFAGMGVGEAMIIYIMDVRRGRIMSLICIETVGVSLHIK